MSRNGSVNLPTTHAHAGAHASLWAALCEGFPSFIHTSSSPNQLLCLQGMLLRKMYSPEQKMLISGIASYWLQAQVGLLHLNIKVVIKVPMQNGQTPKVSCNKKKTACWLSPVCLPSENKLTSRARIRTCIFCWRSEIQTLAVEGPTQIQQQAGNTLHCLFI